MYGIGSLLPKSFCPATCVVESLLCSHTRSSGQIFAKVEYLNPGGSIKDRVACRIIQVSIWRAREFLLKKLVTAGPVRSLVPSHTRRGR